LLPKVRAKEIFPEEKFNIINAQSRCDKMYLDYSGAGGRKYYRIVEPYKEDGKVKKDEIVYLGRLTDKQVKAAKDLINIIEDKEIDHIIAHKDDIRVEDVRESGRVELIENIWNFLSLSEIIDDLHTNCQAEHNCEDIAFSLVAHRCIHPGSKVDFLRWIDSTEIPLKHEIDPDELYPNAVYRTMDHLYSIENEFEEKIFDKLQDRFDISTDSVWYDITSTYLEGEGPSSAKYGYSRDKRPDCVQVNWGLVLSEEGIPITHKIYPGNTADKSTVMDMKDKLKNRFDADLSVLVGDKGMIKEEIRHELDDEGWHYVLGDMDKNVKKEIFENLGDEPVKKLREVEEGVKVGDFWTVEKDDEGNEHDVRIVVSYDEEKAKDEEKSREEWLSEGERSIEEVEDMVKREKRSLKDHDVVLKRIIKRLDRKGLEPYFELDIPETPVEDFTYERKQDKIDELKRLDGTFAIRTNIRDMKAEKIVQKYKDLKWIEQSFRIIKDVNFIRPIYHHLEKRVECHIFICYLALLLERTIEHLLKLQDRREPASRVLQKLSGIYSAQVKGEDFSLRKKTPMDEEQKDLLDFFEAAE